jgi:hypothetical protein
MSPRRLLLTAALATLAACNSGDATRRSSADDPRAADVAGLLVSFAGTGEGQDSAATTLLLDWRDGTPRLASRLEGIVVPRADGVRWVGCVTRCTVGEGGEGWVGRRTFLSSDQEIWVARPGDTVQVQVAGAPCASLAHALYLARVEERRVRDSLRAVTPDSLRTLDLDEDEQEFSETPVNEGDFCYVSTREIGFVDDTIVAYAHRRSSTEFCNPAKYETSGANVVRRLDEDGDSTSIALYALLSPQLRDSLHTKFSGDLDCAFTDSTGADRAWSLRHEEGAWRASAWFDGAIACRGGQDVPLDVPLAFVRDTRLAMPMDSLRRATGAWDAATSPSGRWTVLPSLDTLRVAHASATRVDPAALVVPMVPHRIVMLRGLGAAEVERVQRTMSESRRPVVRVRMK